MHCYACALLCALKRPTRLLNQYRGTKPANRRVDFLTTAAKYICVGMLGSQLRAAVEHTETIRNTGKKSRKTVKSVMLQNLIPWSSPDGQAYLMRQTGSTPRFPTSTTKKRFNRPRQFGNHQSPENHESGRASR